MVEPLSMFLSYARGDQHYADQLVRALHRDGIKVVKDDQSLHSGDASKLAESIRGAQLVVVVLSRNTRDDAWVSREIAAALEGENADRPIIPVLLDREAQDNVVWPLVADREPIGPSIQEVCDACGTALRGAPPTAAAARLPWYRTVMAVVAVAGFGAAAYLLGAAVSHRPHERDPFSVSVSTVGEPSRGGQPKTGDRLLLRDGGTDLVAVYRDGKLVLQCPRDARCTQTKYGWSADLELVGPGLYRTIHAIGARDLALTGFLDEDMLLLRQSHHAPNILPLVVGP